ncbi:cell surface protein [Lactobacillus sp. CBA3605]|uniref:collagen-binding domain-containing protein n=1 Tax=Lactobacillus sp. CBA3605 TaxID=2099788 RepID=UPI000CFC40C0|nr:collagen-binding domain-containing protein [Lactobacillus sp. CBA3605]AVK61129.1 cell surface protein [Lactobacillus sp. CBA3605]
MASKRTHFKMYKIGRRWVFTCAVMAVLSGVTVTANAETMTSQAAVTSTTTAITQESTSASESVATSSSSSDIASSSSDTNASASSVSAASQTSTSSVSQASSTSVSQTAITSASTEKSSQFQTPTSQATATSTTSSAASSVASESSAVSAVSNTAKPSVAPVTSSQKTPSIKTATKATMPVANDAVAAGGTVTDDYPDLHNLLGVSSQFHIFAREAELNAHTNGNIAVANLSGNVNFGTSIIEELLDKDISYIQHVTTIANSSFVSAGDTRENKVIFGENVDVDVSNPKRPKVNGVDIDHLLAKEVYQDKAGTVYIDFDEEFAKLAALNVQLSDESPVATYTNADFSDHNQRAIDVSDLVPDADGKIVINLAAEVLATSTPLTITGLSADKDGNTVLINVDTNGATDYHVNSQIKVIYDDGTDRNNQETEDFGDNHLLWNFYDASANDKLVTGTISIDRPFQGSVLAPAAEVIANQNLDGNIIADRVIVNAETHRWDLQDNTDNKNDPETPEYEKPVSPTIDVDLPTVTPEEPDYEKPVPPTIDVDLPTVTPEEPDYEKPVPPTIDVDLPTVTPEEPDYEKPVPPTIDVDLPTVTPEEPDYEKPVPPTIDVDLPTVTPEEPDYEKPVPPTIDVDLPSVTPEEPDYETAVPPMIDAELPATDSETDDDGEVDVPDEVDEVSTSETTTEEDAAAEVDEEAAELEDVTVLTPTVEAELATEFENILIEPKEDQLTDETVLLAKIDQLIKQAQDQPQSATRVATLKRLVALRARVVTAMQTAHGQQLPQTNDSQSQWVTILGMIGVILLSSVALFHRHRA